MILVAGSTGMVGLEICRLLAEKGKSVKAMVRTTSDSAKVDRLKSLGVQLVTCDLCDPDTLKSACEDVEAVICTISAMPFSYQPGVNDIQNVDLEGVISLIDAAKAAGVKHFIDVSFSKNLNSDFPLRNAKRAVEKHLMESGLIYTILRPSCFMEVWLGPAVGFDPANGKITVYGTGDQLIGWISFKDVALFAVESLTNPAARNKALELGGTLSLSYHQVIKIFEEVSKRTFEVTYVPREALHQQVLAAQDPMQKSFAGLMECVAVGDPIEMTETLKQFPLKLISVRDHAISVMG
jgi:uncharacterized protein YbjT (DUF2867 family)